MTDTCNSEISKRGRPPLNALARLRHKTWFRYLAQKCEAEGYPTSDAQIAKLIYDDANYSYAVRRWRLGQYCVSGGTVDLVEQRIPGTKLVYEFGPSGCPLWASIAGIDLCHAWEATRIDPLLWHSWTTWRYTDDMGNIECPYDGHEENEVITICPPPISLFREKTSLYELMYEIIEFNDQSKPLIILCALLSMSHLRKKETILFREEEIELCLSKYALTISDIIGAAQEFGSTVATMQNKLDHLYELEKAERMADDRGRQWRWPDPARDEADYRAQHYPQNPASFLPRSLST